MLPAGAATERLCALQSAVFGSVARAQRVCARSATAKRPPGAQQWSSQQRAKSTVLQFMQELAESSTMLLQPLFHGRLSHFELVSPIANVPCLSLLAFYRRGQLH
jgi:hypothetical protein